MNSRFLFVALWLLSPPVHAAEPLVGPVKPPPDCASAENANECAELLKKLGKNPFEAFGEVGREPVYSGQNETPAPPCKSGAASCNPWERDWSKTRLSPGAIVTDGGTITPPPQRPFPWNYLYDWQTLIAGLLAVLAAWRTIRATIESANREIAASQAQTAVSQKQIETAVRLEQDRVARERFAFQAMFEAAMGRVIAEAKEAREIFSKAQPVEQTGHPAEYSEAFDKFAERLSEGARYARENFTKHAFSELRGACLSYGGIMTAEFLELESLIDKFASVTTHMEMLGARDQPTLVRVGYHEGFEDELTDIETKARHLREEAAEAMAEASAVMADTDH
jgi:hypothetical protein